ncbi:MAG TPA: calcium/sodium antiporter [Thermodesulfobacteriota bacterium]|nr:calcium/sodium antiporter [Deltaproteobacteria bacterium]HOC39725.1 calcium/sodium antiporter [Thermodesulfobacteriota bacterium]
MNDYLTFVIGIVCAGIGGELFVRGAVGLAHWARVSAGIIGATVAAFATSSPELAVAVNSALAGEPQISLGDVLGSNVVNVALILGLALVISGIHCSRDSVRRDFPVALVVPILLGLLLLDGRLSRIDGAFLMAVFLVWLVAAIIEAMRQRSAVEEVLGESKALLSVVFSIGGLALLVVAGRLIVAGAGNIARAYGIDDFVIGATVVAIGTSAPELATTVIAKLRGHDEIGLGTILGSNIYNCLFIVATASLLCPIEVAWREAALALIFGLLSVAFVFPSRRSFIERRRGVLLLVLYAAYLVAVLQ